MTTTSLDMYVAGGARTSASYHDVWCPATDDLVGRVAWAGVGDVDAALEAAASSFPAWSTSPIAERARLMGDLRDAVIDGGDRLRGLVHLENGKPWTQTAEDLDALVAALDFYASQIAHLDVPTLTDRAGTHRHVLEYQPVGVVGAFLAWNFPLLNLAFKLGPALAAGCPIVIKPSFKTPLSAYAVGELCEQVGLPPGVVNILCGPDDVVGDAISASPIPAMLTVIGSTRTGRRVIEQGASSIKRYSMELGGNAPVIVFDDADLDTAVSTIADLKFGNAGQTCVAPNRVFVHRAVVDEVADRFVERAAATVVGFDRDHDVDMGPLIDRPARDRVLALIEEALADGATLQFGGQVPTEFEQRGAFLTPTVLTGVETSMRIATEEVFGPVVSLVTFDDDNAVISAANDTEAGLASYVFTGDLARAEATTRQLRFGEVHVNGVRYGIDLPHGGIKQSGIGVDCSSLALHDYLAPKRISWAVAS